MLERLLLFAYDATRYLIFLATFLYAIGSAAGFARPAQPASSQLNHSRALVEIPEILVQVQE